MRGWTMAVVGGVLAAVPAAAQAPLTHQNLYDTLPNLPELYAARTAQFAVEPATAGRIVFLGNSITQGGDWGALLGDSTVLNRGIGGDITGGVLRRLDEVIRHRPSQLFLLIGINDIGKDIPDAVIADNVRRIVERVRLASPATRVYVQSVLPVNPQVHGFPQHYDKQPRVDAVNRLLRGVAARTGATWVDAGRWLRDRRGRLDARLTGDGLHLNTEGYRVWVAGLRHAGHLR